MPGDSEGSFLRPPPTTAPQVGAFSGRTSIYTFFACLRAHTHSPACTLGSALDGEREDADAGTGSFWDAPFFQALRITPRGVFGRRRRGAEIHEGKEDGWQGAREMAENGRSATGTSGSPREGIGGGVLFLVLRK